MAAGAFVDVCLALGLVAAVSPSLREAAGPGMSSVAILAATVVAAGLLLLPRALAAGGLSWRLLYPALAAAALAGLAQWGQEPARGILAGPAAVAAMVLLMGLTAANLPRVERHPHLALGWIHAVLFVLAASPLWLAAVLESQPLPQGVVDALIAVNPLTPLALATGTDFPRSDWMYRLSPLGSIRYSYPRALWLVLAYIILCGLLVSRPWRGLAKARAAEPDMETTS